MYQSEQKQKAEEILKAVIWHFNRCPLLPFTTPLRHTEWSNYYCRNRGEMIVVNLHTADWCGPLSPLPTGFLLNIRQGALVLRLLPCAALHAFLFLSKAEYLRNCKVCFLFSIRPVHSRLWWLWIFSVVRDSLIVEMKSRKRSFGKMGFSSPLKYSFSTPATELISCSFWSSIRGSSPDKKKYVSFQWWQFMSGKMCQMGLSC